MMSVREISIVQAPDSRILIIVMNDNPDYRAGFVLVDSPNAKGSARWSENWRYSLWELSAHPAHWSQLAEAAELHGFNVVPTNFETSIQLGLEHLIKWAVTFADR